MAMPRSRKDANGLCYTTQEAVIFSWFFSRLQQVTDVPRHYALEKVINATCSLRTNKSLTRRASMGKNDEDEESE